VDTSRDSRRVADMGMLQANLGSGWREISRTFRSEAISAAMYELTVWVRDPHTTSGTGSHARIDRVELNYAATNCRVSRTGEPGVETVITVTPVTIVSV
jgi:hypothetical protein